MLRPPAFAPTLVASVVAFAVGCAPPPQGVATETSPAAETVDRGGVPPVDEGAGPDVYELESEGHFDENTPDVEFAEDELPPRPEDVRAAALADEAVAGEDVEPAEEDLPVLEGSVDLPVEPSVVVPVKPGADYAVELGFRVQLLALEEKAEAERAAMEAQQRLQVPAYVVFEAPYHKVRIGDFLDRADALQARDRAKANGYEGAWVVSDEIRRPRR